MTRLGRWNSGIQDDIRNAAETRAKNRAFNEFLEKAIADVNIEILLPKKEDAAVAPDAPAGAPEGASETAEERAARRAVVSIASRN